MLKPEFLLEIVVIRNKVLDNTKFLMILLVAYGHLLEALIDQSVVIKSIYLSIYSFHMPVFILLSGILTKIDYSQDRMEKTITSILIPFLAFTFLFETMYIMTYGKMSEYTMNFEPFWILWFLFSLFLWKMFLPVVIKFRYPITLSIIIALLAGYIDSVGYFFGLGRTLYFFPFFLIGHKLSVFVLSDERLINKPKILFISILVLNIALFGWFNNIQHQWLFGSESYSALGVDSWYAAIIRLGIYGISIITSISILMLVPSTESKISTYGSNSLYVYVWHGFFIKIFASLGLISFIWEVSSLLALWILFFIALALTIILSTEFVEKNTQRFVLKPVKNILLKN